MTRYTFTFLCLTAFNFSCSHSNKVVPPEKISKASPFFFPVTNFISGQISDLRQMPVTPLKITSENGQVDSVWIKATDVEGFAAPFLHPVIDSATLSRFYIESSFLDQTLNSVTLTYDPINYLHDPLSLKSLVVYIDPQTNKVTRIFIEKPLSSTQGIDMQQLTWKSGSWCKITTIHENEGNPPSVKEEKVTWNFDE